MIKTNIEIKIGDKIVVKNEFRYFDIVEVLDIYKSIENGHLIYNCQSIGFAEIRILDYSYILGIFNEREGVNLHDYITEKRK